MGNSQELAGAITNMLKDDAVRLRMGRSGAERAKKFCLEAHSKTMMDIFEKVIGIKKTNVAKLIHNQHIVDG